MYIHYKWEGLVESRKTSVWGGEWVKTNPSCSACSCMIKAPREVISEEQNFVAVSYLQLMKLFVYIPHVFSR